MGSLRVEEYLETIYEICQEKKIAKVSDIKKALNIESLASITEMVQKLAKIGLVDYEKYRGLTLTEKGLELAKKLKQKHVIIEELLMILGVEQETAVKDACKIEHVISEESVSVIAKFVCFLRAEENKDFIRKFRKKFKNVL
ncbi:MAG: metal-dependent transcriptional regulator [Candidatus Heimdallarchaeaceae archaeon]